MMAAGKGHHECVSILVANGADINYRVLRRHDCGKRRGSYISEIIAETALTLAVTNGHHQCVSILVANGADVNDPQIYVSRGREVCAFYCMNV